MMEDCQQRQAALLAEAFGNDTTAAVMFMMRPHPHPHPQLQNKTPDSAVATEAGCHEVEAIIHKGLHGLPV